MKATILGGILFLVPVVFLAIVLGKAFEIGLMVAEPIDNVIPVERVAGVAFINLIAIALIAVLCFLAGLVAQSSWRSRRVDKLDNFLIDLVPGYAVAKGMIGSMAKGEDTQSDMIPILVQFDDYEQIAFEIERNDTHAVVFLPGAPSAWSGSVVMVDIRRIDYLKVPMHQTVKLMRVLGRGTLAADGVAGLAAARLGGGVSPLPSGSSAPVPE